METITNYQKRFGRVKSALSERVEKIGIAGEGMTALLQHPVSASMGLMQTHWRETKRGRISLENQDRIYAILSEVVVYSFFVDEEAMDYMKNKVQELENLIHGRG